MQELKEEDPYYLERYINMTCAPKIPYERRFYPKVILFLV
jgi:hypothetical protein